MCSQSMVILSACTLFPYTTLFRSMVELYADWCAKYPIISIEDGLAEGDQAGWKLITEKLGKQIQLVGDDLFVTNPAIFREGIANHIANAILIKVNQIGTLSETLEAVEIGRASCRERV